MMRRRPPALAIAIVASIAGAATGCGDVNAARQQLADARQLAADLHVQFTKAADAANRAVMADTDAASATSAREAEQAKEAVKKDIDNLRPMLRSLDYAAESRALEEFAATFAEYETLDRRILALSVENTNLRAQRLSFGPAQEAADAFHEALESVAGSATAGDTWKVRALAASAVAAVRDIQVLQAPHIAEPHDAEMARLEKRMTVSEAAARNALQGLTALVPPKDRPKLSAATAALDRFMEVHAQLLALSRRNTNVRSLAMSLTEKPALTTACEARLQKLQEALAARVPRVARWE
jgi:hypothetical protein